MARILLVEDDFDLNDRLKTWLEFEKYIVESAFTGTDALEQMQFGEFDIIILDWHLPEKDGPDVCKEYRDGGGKAPVLMLTGNDDASARATGLAAGATDFLCKPFDLKALSARIKSLVPAQ
jgi:two-component system, OmpR family, manganese sensing response regulator